MNQSINQSIARSRRAKEARGNPRARRRAPSRPRAFPPPPRGGRRRETPTTRNPRRENARIAASHPRAASSDVANDAPTQMRRRDPIVILYPRIESNRSIALVSGPSHLFHARASCSCSCSYVPCVHFLVDQTCRRRRRASRCAPVACIRGRRRDGTGGRVSRLALCFDVQCAVYVLQ